MPATGALGGQSAGSGCDGGQAVAAATVRHARSAAELADQPRYRHGRLAPRLPPRAFGEVHGGSDVAGWLCLPPGRVGPKCHADHRPTKITATPTIPMTSEADTLSARGPATRVGARLAALTIDASTPNTRPRTCDGIDSSSAVCADTDTTAYAAPAHSATATTNGSTETPTPASTPPSQPARASDAV